MNTVILQSIKCGECGQTSTFFDNDNSTGLLNPLPEGRHVLPVEVSAEAIRKASRHSRCNVCGALDVALFELGAVK